MSEPDDLLRGLVETIAGYQSGVVAFSGGVDSAVVAKAATLALGSQALAVTGVSDSLAEGELSEATAVAQAIGIRHRIVRTSEFTREAYLRNAPDRCYHCKTELYDVLEHVRISEGLAVVLSGTNADDAGEFRPGLMAAAEHNVREPLRECGLTKADVRAIARAWNLPVWNKPATPCLSSRVAYGTDVTPERLRRIDASETILRERGFRTCRVRLHPGELARIEVEASEINRLLEADRRQAILSDLTALGWNYVTMDLQGFRSGSFAPLIQIASS